MKIYHSPLSSNSRKVVMATLHLGLDAELVSIDLTKGEQKRPEHLARNPNGKVPVLVDGDFVLWESHAILAYLADKTPGQTLYPTELAARAQVNQWLFWAANHWGPSISILSFEHFVKKFVGGGEPDPGQVKRGEAQFTDFVQVLDRHLAQRAWVAAETLTLADLAIAASLMYLVPAKLPIAPHTNVLAWFDRVQALDVWKKTSV
jgi:glutathione S-transferase